MPQISTFVTKRHDAPTLAAKFDKTARAPFRRVERTPQRFDVLAVTGVGKFITIRFNALGNLDGGQRPG